MQVCMMNLVIETARIASAICKTTICKWGHIINKQVNPKSGPPQPAMQKEGFGNIARATPPELTVPQHRKALALGPAGVVATAGSG